MGVLDYRRWLTRPRPVEAQIHLATRVIDNEHEDDVAERAKLSLGSRASLIKILDLSRNPLRSYTERVGRAYSPPPAVSGLGPALAAVLDDHSATTAVDEYAEIGSYPLPTTVLQACQDAQRYRLGVGYGAIHIGYSERTRTITMTVIRPSALEPTYASTDPQEPTRVRYLGSRTVDGQARDVIEDYDLTRLDAPTYRVMLGNQDVTAQVNDGRTYEGEGYIWRYADGRPYIPVVLTGTTRHPYATMPLVEATLQVAVRWSAWGIGCDHASHPQRHVRGLVLAGMDSSATSGTHGETGIATGPETVLVWHDVDPDRPGDHWQDAPAFDPEVTGRAIRTYETSAMSALGLPLDYEATGGEPAAREAEALEQMIASTYPDNRRLVASLLLRCAAYAATLAADGLIDSGDYGTGPFGALFREEIRAALGAQPTLAPAPAAETPEEE